MIVVGGEALIDLVPTESDEARRLPALVPRLGGGPFNVAVAAARLAAPVSFLSRVSSDRFGQAIRATLAESGVDTSMLQEGSEPSTLAVVSVSPGGSAEYTFYTQGTADRLFEDPGPLPAEVGYLSLGTLGMVLEPGATAYENVLRREAARGVLTVLDPNIRADLITDPAAYRTRFASWLPDIRLLKLSFDDAEWLSNGVDPIVSARMWRDHGVSAVVLTNGAQGFVAVTEAGEFTVPTPPAKVVDTIGAGDTVQGALLAWLGCRHIVELDSLTETDWRAALAFAGAAAAVTVSRAGAQPPTLAELST